MDFNDQENLNTSSASSLFPLLLENENSTSFNLTENFDSNGTASTDRPGGNGTRPTEPPLKEFDFLNPIWNVAFSTTVITGTVGNLIVLWIVLGKPNFCLQLSLW